MHMGQPFDKVFGLPLRVAVFWMGMAVFLMACQTSSVGLIPARSANFLGSLESRMQSLMPSSQMEMIIRLRLELHCNEC